MVDKSQFGSAGQQGGQAGPVSCATCESVLADALDGLLTSAEQAAFDQHVVACAACAGMTQEARRGLAWLEMLKGDQPEAPMGLVDRILAQTSGKDPAVTAPFVGSQSPVMSSASIPPATNPNTYPGVYRSQTAVPAYGKKAPLWQRANLVAVRQTLLQPRLAMTAAMAFFSISLTMNLLGVRLSDIAAIDLRPSSLRRQFYEANAHVVRYYDNLRVVYELESRVQELRRATDQEPRVNSEPQPRLQEQSPAPEKKEEQRPAAPGNGTSLRQVNSDTHTARTQDKQPGPTRKAAPQDNYQDGYFEGGSVEQAAYPVQSDGCCNEGFCSNWLEARPGEMAWCTGEKWQEKNEPVQINFVEHGFSERKLA